MSAEDVIAEEIAAIQSMCEWDHGVEPNALDASYSNTEDIDGDDDLKGHEADIFDSPKRLVKKVQTVATKFMHDLSEKYEQAIHYDTTFQQDVAERTEEEVAGTKMCVTEAAHSDSFVAPC